MGMGKEPTISFLICFTVEVLGVFCTVLRLKLAFLNNLKALNHMTLLQVHGHVAEGMTLDELLIHGKVNQLNNSLLAFTGVRVKYLVGAL